MPFVVWDEFFVAQEAVSLHLISLLQCLQCLDYFQSWLMLQVCAEQLMALVWKFNGLNAIYCIFLDWPPWEEDAFISDWKDEGERIKSLWSVSGCFVFKCFFSRLLRWDQRLLHSRRLIEHQLASLLCVYPVFQTIWQTPTTTLATCHQHTPTRGRLPHCTMGKHNPKSRSGL